LDREAVAFLADPASVVLPPMDFRWEQYGRTLISNGGVDVQSEGRS
jgi:hypothetical protein